MTALLPCLRHLPATVVALGFQLAGDEQQGGQIDHGQFWRDLLSILPPHVDHLLLQPQSGMHTEGTIHLVPLLIAAGVHQRSCDLVVHLVLQNSDPGSAHYRAVEDEFNKLAMGVKFEILLYAEHEDADD